MKNRVISFIDSTIFSLILFSFINVLTNFFFPLNQITNTIIYLLIIFFSFFIKEELYFNRKIFFSILLLISIIGFFLVIFDTVNRPDAYLYHLPYSQILNNEKIIIGLSNLHFRFAHISIIQYLSSSNFTWINNASSILSPMAIFWSLILIYFAHDILKIIKKDEVFSIGKLFSIFALIYISYKINRYGEFGNDAVGHLTIFYIVSKFIYHKEGDKINFYIICVLCVFAIANKIFFAISLIIPFYILIREKLNILKIFFSLPTFLLMLWLIKNILISGCAIYPIKETCFDNLTWTNFDQIEREAVSGEAWAKAWPERYDKKISMEEFNKNFNWISAWSKKHLKIIVKIILPYFLLILIILIFSSDKNDKRARNAKLSIILLFSLIGSIIFLFKFPLYRYGYSYLIIFIISLNIYVFEKYVNINKFMNICKITLIFCIITLISKQTIRIIKHHNISSPVPILSTEKSYKKIYVNNEFYYFLTEKECMYKVYPCTSLIAKNLKFKKKHNYKILYY